MLCVCKKTFNKLEIAFFIRKKILLSIGDPKDNIVHGIDPLNCYQYCS